MRTSRAIAIPTALLSLSLVAGCGPSSSNAASATSTSGSSATSATTGGGTTASASAGSTDAAAECPTSNTRSFAKTRFATDVGLAIGSFHRYIWKPYQAGSFKKGTSGRIKALLKGGTTAALDVKLMRNAQANIKANPTLCKKLYAPMSDAITKLDAIKGNVVKGDFSGLGAANSVLGGILSKGNSSGADIKESSTGTGDAG